MGMEDTQLGIAIRFEQKRWMKIEVGKHIELRANVDTEIRKLQSNDVNTNFYGKIMNNMKKSRLCKCSWELFDQVFSILFFGMKDRRLNVMNLRCIGIQLMKMIFDRTS